MADAKPKLRIRPRQDPTTARALEHPPDVGIRSDARDTLASELLLYISGHLGGLSYLIAGHRGSGKTTLVWQVCLHLLKLSRDRELGMRPLMVPLNGPRLLPAEPIRTDHAGPGGDAHDDKATGKNSTNGPQIDKIGNDVDRALIEFSVGVCAQVAKALARAFRERIKDRNGKVPDREMRRLFELAARLELELDLAPRADTLREFWSQGGFLDSGVLFTGLELQRRPGQGMRELLALSTACDVYRRVSGVFTKNEETLTDNASRTNSMETGVNTEGKDVLSPLLALLTGGLVGTGVALASGPTAGVISGLIGALGASSVFKMSNARVRNRSVARASNYERDLTLNTLDRELPKLVERIRDAGLAPIFIIDELDKVDLDARITQLVRDLKTFVAEQAAFCFLADRSYYEKIVRKSALEAYPKEHTYFKRPLFIAHGHRELYDFLTNEQNGRITLSESDPDLRQDQSVLPYCLLHKARMHPIDLDRCVAALDDGEGGIDLELGAVRSRYSYRMDLTIQLAIEMLLDTRDVDALFRVTPQYRRFVHDALYYLSRCWADRGEIEVDLSPAGFAKFLVYLRERVGRPAEPANHPQNAAAPKTPAAAADRLSELMLSGAEREWLWNLVKRLVRLLSDPMAFATMFTTWRQISGSSLDNEVVNALGIAPQTGPLLARVHGTYEKFRWRRDASGRRLLPRNDQAIRYELKIAQACRFSIDTFSKELGAIGEDAAEDLYDETVATAIGNWKEQSRVFIAQQPGAPPVDLAAYREKVLSDCWLILVGYLTIIDPTLGLQVPDDLGIALWEARQLPPMLQLRGPGALDWVVGADGRPLMQPPTPAPAPQAPAAQAFDHSVDLKLVRDFAKLVASWSSL